MKVIATVSVRSGRYDIATCQLSVVFKPLAVKSSQLFNKQRPAILIATRLTLGTVPCPCRENRSLTLAPCTHNQYTHADSLANMAHCFFIQHAEVCTVNFFILKQKMLPESDGLSLVCFSGRLLTLCSEQNIRLSVEHSHHNQLIYTLNWTW